jgi:hypothetical protein
LSALALICLAAAAAKPAPPGGHLEIDEVHADIGDPDTTLTQINSEAVCLGLVPPEEPERIEVAPPPAWRRCSQWADGSERNRISN